MSWSPLLEGVYILYPWQSVSVPASGSASPSGTSLSGFSGAFVIGLSSGGSFPAVGSGTLEVYLSLPSGVTATLKISNAGGSVSISLSSGLSQIPINQGDSVSLSLSNSNTTAATAIAMARVVPTRG